MNLSLKCGFQIQKSAVKCGLLGCNAMQFRDNLTFWSNTSPPSSGSMSKPSKKPAEAGGRLSTKTINGSKGNGTLVGT
jgi:hypothetical protein